MNDLLARLNADPTSLLAILGGGVILLGAAVGFWRFQVYRRRNINRRLRDACEGVLADFVIPDGNGEQIQVQYALLTGRGIIVLDIKDVKGHVFGSEAMQDWTVIADDRRYTFSNPQPGLWDRVAAVKRIATDAPVTGVVAFTDRARFTKGQPRSVTQLETLMQELMKDRAASRDRAGSGYADPWERLRQAAIGARMDLLLTKRRV